ncbi:hypothetical protein ACIJDO_002214 [Enterococcus hirae]
MSSEDCNTLFCVGILFYGLWVAIRETVKLAWNIGVSIWNGCKSLKKRWNKRQERKLMAKEKQDLNQETKKVPLFKDEQVPGLKPIRVVEQQQNSERVSVPDDKKSIEDVTTGAVRTSINTRNSLTSGFQINNGCSEIVPQH